MTVAVDIRTGAVVGQVCAALPPSTLKTGLDASVDALALLTRTGYVYVPRASVRLEEMA
jgi:hypothetical protein